MDGYDECKTGDDRWLRYPDGGQHTFRKEFDTRDTASAFTVAELGEMLKHKRNMLIPVTIDDEWHGADLIKNEHLGLGRLDEITEADARAKMLVYLLENRLITA